MRCSFTYEHFEVDLSVSYNGAHPISYEIDSIWDMNKRAYVQLVNLDEIERFSLNHQAEECARKNAALAHQEFTEGLHSWRGHDD